MAIAAFRGAGRGARGAGCGVRGAGADAGAGSPYGRMQPLVLHASRVAEEHAAVRFQPGVRLKSSAWWISDTEVQNRYRPMTGEKPAQGEHLRKAGRR